MDVQAEIEGAEGRDGPALPQLLEQLPVDALLPVGWLRRAVAAWQAASTAGAALPPWLTTAQFAAHYHPTRTEEWVRDMCKAQRLPGAVRRGRQWLIPSACLVDGPAPANTGLLDRSLSSPTTDVTVARAPRSGASRPKNTRRY